jgi:hypothetical protein
MLYARGIHELRLPYQFSTDSAQSFQVLVLVQQLGLNNQWMRKGWDVCAYSEEMHAKTVDSVSNAAG